MNFEIEVINAALEVERSGLTKGTWGNVSVRNGDDMYITPSGTKYNDLKKENIAKINIRSGEIISGNKTPSSELALHQKLYQNFDNINAIVHTHSLYASAFAAMDKSIKCYIEDHAQIIGGKILVSPYALPGTKKLAENVVNILQNGNFAALMSHHGGIAIGRNITEAMMVATILEKSANIGNIINNSNNNAKELSKEDIFLMRNNYLKSYSKNIIKNIGE